MPLKALIGTVTVIDKITHYNGPAIIAEGIWYQSSRVRNDLSLIHNRAFII